ncbi:substrate-binding domain-containing protein [Streptomyces cavourensis]
MKHWLRDRSACPGVQLRNNPIGSGGGVAQVLRGAMHFDGSDNLLWQNDVEFSRSACAGSRAIDVPMAVGLVALGYNVEGVDSLVLDASTLTRIFDSRITMWNDPEIWCLNPGALLAEIKDQCRAPLRQFGCHAELERLPGGCRTGAVAVRESKGVTGQGAVMRHPVQTRSCPPGAARTVRSVLRAVLRQKRGHIQRIAVPSTAVAPGQAAAEAPTGSVPIAARIDGSPPHRASDHRGSPRALHQRHPDRAPRRIRTTALPSARHHFRGCRRPALSHLATQLTSSCTVGGETSRLSAGLGVHLCRVDVRSAVC